MKEAPVIRGFFLPVLLWNLNFRPDAPPRRKILIFRLTYRSFTWPAR
jgi:hypothetical protein